MKSTVRTLTLLASASLGILAAGVHAQAADVTLVIESWRNDDLSFWNEKIIPAFEKSHPGIKLKFEPSAPTEYNAAVQAKLDGGTAGDIVACRPFDASLALFKKGQLAAVNDVPGIDKFSSVAKAAWSTDDGKQTFCVPVAAVLHGFMYNKDAFKKLGITPPKTEDEFFADLEKIKKDGTYIPLDMGTKDQWEAATMGYQNIGPNYWHGEEGRLALIAGKEKLTDPNGLSLSRCLPSGRPIWAMATRRRPMPIAKTSSRSAAPRSIRLARGKSGLQGSVSVRDRRVPAAGQEGGRYLLRLRSR